MIQFIVTISLILNYIDLLSTQDPSYSKVQVKNPVILKSVAHIGIPSACFLKPDPGPCSKDMIRIYFDFRTYTCKAFSYSGCGGNANRFVSIKNCYKLCHPFYRQRLIVLDDGTGDANASAPVEQSRENATSQVIAAPDVSKDNDDDQYVPEINQTHVVPPNAPTFNSTEEPVEVQVVHEYDIYERLPQLGPRMIHPYKPVPYQYNSIYLPPKSRQHHQVNRYSAYPPQPYYYNNYYQPRPLPPPSHYS